jgi:hypothetical protein
VATGTDPGIWEQRQAEDLLTVLEILERNKGGSPRNY